MTGVAGTPTPPGLVRPDTDPMPDPIAVAVGHVRRAVVYAAPAGYRPLELDLYTPALAEASPVIVFLHGGGWRMGSRAVFCPTWRDWTPDPFQRLVAAGFAVASVDYRLSAEAVFPAQLDDVKAAVMWLRTRAAELGVDATRVVAWGESAGGHLAALLGLADPGVRVAGVVDWYGASDLLTLSEQALPNAVAHADAPDSRESLLIGAPLLEAPARARRASPMAYVRPGAPPFHIAHGDADRFIPAAQSTQLADALRSAGNEVEYTVVPGADHLWMGATDPGGIFDAAVAFTRRVTARAAAPGTVAPVAHGSEPNTAGSTRLEEELTRLRAERRTLAADLAGEDPDDPGVGDHGDQAQAIEGDADLARIDRRINEIDHLITSPDAADAQTGLADGTLVTLRFPGGEVATFHVVAIVEEAGAEEFLTADSPLGRALVGHSAGDTVTYLGPDGDLRAEIVELRPPSS